MSWRLWGVLRLWKGSQSLQAFQASAGGFFFLEEKIFLVSKIEDRRLCRRSFFESSKQRHPGASGRPPGTRRLCLGCPEIVGGLLEAPGCFCFENPDKGLLQNLRSSISERRPNKNHKPLINRKTLYQCPPLLY